MAERSANLPGAKIKAIPGFGFVVAPSPDEKPFIVGPNGRGEIAPPACVIWFDEASDIRPEQFDYAATKAKDYYDGS